MKRCGMLVAAVLISTAAFVKAEDYETRSFEKRGEEVSGSIGKGLYSKPVWRRAGKGTYLGGYIDFNFKDAEGSVGRFDQHRLIPFIYADIAEGLRFATEIELEHGGPQNNQRDGDAKVEFAVLDYDLWGEKLGLRGGIILSPLGKINLVHDSPLQDLTERPLVSQLVIPTTLSESGAGVFGTLYPTELQKLDYEVYVVNGFNGTATSTTLTAPAGGGAVTTTTTRTQGGAITAANGVRSARGSQRNDNNDNKAAVGRLGWSPRLGYELGFSGHHGAYDDAGQNDLTIMAVDAGAQFGPLEILGEAARADVDKDATISAATPESLRGWYGQANYHFLQDKLRSGSTFTAVFRYDNYDTDRSKPVNRLTYGLNFRPVEDAVFMVNYQVNQETPRSDNNAILLSFASYF
jgi:hypothetical protein